MGGSLHRRTVLQSGAFAAGAFAFGGALWDGSASAAPAAPESVPPITGRLIAWLVIDVERETSLRLAELDAARPAREIASITLPAPSVMAASAEANAWAVAAVAQSWRVPPSECAIGHGCIVHRASGRAVPYAVWIDFA
ncbi:MAG TPA: hypothetical protein VJ779_19955 [Acetobacteraceae bacterium]|nr:hypothetical protein [Acetobacteraceae bacterium]